MSKQLKEKQQQSDNKREFDADQIFNQHLFRTLAYAGAGFGAGMVASLFFKHKKMITLLGTGAGAAYGGQSMMRDLNQYTKFSQGQQPHTLKRDDQLATKNWDSFMPKEESLSQQKRFGGSDDSDSDKKENKPNPESRGSQGKSSEKKGHEATLTKPTTQAKSPSESLHSTPTGTKQNASATRSSHNRENDKSSYEFGKNKGESSKTSSHDRSNDKSSRHFGETSSSSSKSSGHHDVTDKTTHKAGSSKDHKESDKSNHETRMSNQTSQGGKGQDQRQSRGQETTTKSEALSANSPSGQHFQDFKSNPTEAGKPKPGESTTNRGAERPRNVDKAVEHLRDAHQNRAEQDYWGKTPQSGISKKLQAPSETAAGHQFHSDNLSAKSQENVVIE